MDHHDLQVGKATVPRFLRDYRAVPVFDRPVEDLAEDIAIELEPALHTRDVVADGNTAEVHGHLEHRSLCQGEVLSLHRDFRIAKVDGALAPPNTGRN